ncbi:unnamed protein product, partial [marine sediment metagenome]
DETDKKTAYDFVQDMLDMLFEYDAQSVINWVNKKRREGWALGESPLFGDVPKKERE